MIESFEPVFLEPHGGDLTGFILVRGDAEKPLHSVSVTSSPSFRSEWASSLTTSALLEQTLATGSSARWSIHGAGSGVRVGSAWRTARANGSGRSSTGIFFVVLAAVARS